MPTNNKGLKELWGYPLIDEKARNAISDTRSSLENDFQKKTDDTLGTVDKTVPGAINEIKNNIDNIGDNFTSEQSETKYDMKYNGKSIGSIGIELKDNQIAGGDGSFNIDLTPYQTKTDTSLTTTNKTISGAIKELNTQYKDIENLSDNVSIEFVKQTSGVSLNSALNYDKSNLTFKNTEYTISDSLNFKSNKKYDGNATIIKPTPGLNAGTTLSNITSANNISINNFIFQGDMNVGDGNDGLHIFDVKNSNDISINNCVFTKNAYCGSRYINSYNINIRDSKYITVDCGIVTLGETANNFYIDNCIFDGHSRSESISFYSTERMSDISINNVNIKNKATTSICLGHEDTKTYPNSQVDKFSIANVITDNVTRTLLVVNASNGSINNIVNKKGNDYNYAFLEFNKSNNIIINNCYSEDTKWISILVNPSSNNLYFSNITLKNPGNGATNTNEKSYFLVKGNYCVFDNINCIEDNNDIKRFYVEGSNNIFTNINYISYNNQPCLFILQRGAINNYIQINNMTIVDYNLSYTEYAKNKFKYNKEYRVVEKWILEDLFEGVSNRIHFKNTLDSTLLDFKKISLLNEGDELYYKIESPNINTTINLGGNTAEDNLVFKTTDSITLNAGKIICFKFICENKKWYEIDRIIF